MSAIQGLASTGLSIPVSKIRELANRSMGTQGLIPLWFGEPDVPSEAFVAESAYASLAGGNTFYTEGLGKPWLREAIAGYMSDLYSRQISKDRVAVTVSGTNAVNLAFQLLGSVGDKVTTTTPSFATLLAVPALQNLDVETVPIRAGSNGWSLDICELLERAKNSKILLLNSPNNPTGWTMERDEMQIVLDACRKTGTWIILDEVYARIVFDGKAAPSFAEIAEPEDRVIIVNSFSKSWAMTGWRLGWLTMPPSLLLECEKLMEFSMSCAPEFVQAGGLVAIEKGEAFIASQIDRYRTGRDISLARLGALPNVKCVPPKAAFYAYFRIEGVEDSVSYAERLASEAKVGIAPGVAFDPTMTDWFRICFAKDESTLHEAFDRIERFMHLGS